MFITPITKIDSIEQLDNAGSITSGTAVSAENPFQSLFQDAVENVKKTEADLNTEIYKVTTGQTDDLHNAVIASTKASLSIELLVQLRNQALNAYKEIMNTGV